MLAIAKCDGGRSLAILLSATLHGGRMTEDERRKLAGTVAEAHAGLREVAFQLRRELTPKAPALKVALKAEREAFRLQREIERLDGEDTEPAQGRTSLPEVRRGGKVVDLDRLRRPKVRRDVP